MPFKWCFNSQADLIWLDAYRRSLFVLTGNLTCILQYSFPVMSVGGISILIRVISVSFIDQRIQFIYNTLYKRLSFFPPQPGCHQPNSPWLGIIKLFLTRENLISDIPAGDGETVNNFLQCIFLKRVFIKFFFYCRHGKIQPPLHPGPPGGLRRGIHHQGLRGLSASGHPACALYFLL